MRGDYPETLYFCIGSAKMDTHKLTHYLDDTTLLDYQDPSIQTLVRERKWLDLDLPKRLAAVYDFVKNEIRFGYNAEEEIPASRVLGEGVGHCNTKATLLMALLRSVELPCRFHAFLIDKRIQEGLFPWIIYRLLPPAIGHSWVEVWNEERWMALEGVILDERYLNGVRKRFHEHKGRFCGFAVATADLQRTDDAWSDKDTFIQREAIKDDLGTFSSPDDYFADRPSNVTGLKGFLWRHFFCKAANRNVEEMRKGQ